MPKSLNNTIGLLEPPSRSGKAENCRHLRTVNAGGSGASRTLQHFIMHKAFSPEQTPCDHGVARRHWLHEQEDLYDNMIAEIRPIQNRFRRLSDPATWPGIESGAARCRAMAQKVMEEVRQLESSQRRVLVNNFC
jgi:hypothetical protein